MFHLSLNLNLNLNLPLNPESMLFDSTQSFQPYSILRHSEHRIANLFRRADRHLTLNHIPCPPYRYRWIEHREAQRRIKWTDTSHEFNSNVRRNDGDNQLHRDRLFKIFTEKNAYKLRTVTFPQSRSDYLHQTNWWKWRGLSAFFSVKIQKDLKQSNRSSL
jgi:hypothetical protein